MLLSILDYIFLTLWGWPGIVLALLAVSHLLERAFRPRLMFSGRSKLMVASAILAIGLFFTWRGLSLPASLAELDEQLSERERESREGARESREREHQSMEAEALHRRAESLRRELADQRGR